jgi:hypothetical protein
LRFAQESAAIEEQIAKKRAEQEAAALEKIRLDQEQEMANAPAIPSRGNQDSILAQQEAEIAAKRAAAAAAKNPVPDPGSPAASESSASGELTPPPLAGPLSIRVPGSGSATLDQAAELSAATAKLKAANANTPRAMRAANKAAADAAAAQARAAAASRLAQTTVSNQYSTDAEAVRSAQARASRGVTPAQAMDRAFRPGSTFRNLTKGGRRKTRRRRRTYREPKGLFAF